jgi:hypothetical protein
VTIAFDAGTVDAGREQARDGVGVGAERDGRERDERERGERRDEGTGRRTGTERTVAGSHGGLRQEKKRELQRAIPARRLPLVNEDF